MNINDHIIQIKEDIADIKVRLDEALSFRETLIKGTLWALGIAGGVASTLAIAFPTYCLNFVKHLFMIG